MESTQTTTEIGQHPGHDVEIEPAPLVATGLLAMAAAFVLMQVLAAELIPPVAVPAVLYVALAIAILRRQRRWMLITSVVVPAVHMGGSFPFIASSLSSPETPATFVPDALAVVAAIVTIGASATALRGSAASARRPLAWGAIVVSVGLTIASVAVAAGVESDVRQPGDIEVEAADVAFPARVEAGSGATLFVDNRDAIHHTFVVEDTDVAADLPGRRAVRIALDLPPGTYDFVCTVPGHESMRGQLVVFS